MHCKTCHYSLDKLNQHRCPECGDGFDPADPGTFAAGPPPEGIFQRVFGGSYPALIFVIFVILMSCLFLLAFIWHAIVPEYF